MVGPKFVDVDLSLANVSQSSVDMIWHDAAHPSRLVVGILPGVKVPNARPQCDTVLMQPCRTDPLGR